MSREDNWQLLCSLPDRLSDIVAFSVFAFLTCLGIESPIRVVSGVSGGELAMFLLTLSIAVFLGLFLGFLNFCSVLQFH